MRTFRSALLVAAAAVVLPAAARADAITESFKITAGLGSTIPAAFSSSSFALFNSADGTLNSVEVTLKGSASWTATTSATLDTGFYFSALGFIGGEQEFSTPGAISIDMSLTTSTSNDLEAFTGTGSGVIELEAELSPDGVSGSFQTVGALSGTVTYNYTPTAVPEPGSLAMLATGLGVFGLIGFAGVTRRRA